MQIYFSSLFSLLHTKLVKEASLLPLSQFSLEHKLRKQKTLQNSVCLSFSWFRIMVLWEVALATAYWLGIRRTYRLSLKLQRRLIGPNHVRVRDFLHRRTRNIFDVALSVHKGIQQRDLSAGKNIGNFILRFLDRARPSANIRGSCAKIKDVGRVKDDNRRTGNLPIMKSTQSEVNKHLFSRHDLNGSHLGSQLSNRYIVGRVCPGSQNTLKSAPGARSFFTLCRGMYITFPSPRLLPAKSIFREDIAQWMTKK